MDGSFVRATVARAIENMQACFLSNVQLVVISIMPLVVLSGGIRILLRFGIAVPSIVQWVLGLSMGFLSMFLATSAVLHNLERHSLGSAPAVGLSLRVAFQWLPMAVVTFAYVTVGVLGGLLLLIIPGLRLMCRWYLVIPVFVLERCSATKAMQRSNELTLGNRWAILAFIVAVALIDWAIRDAASLATNNVSAMRPTLGFFLARVGAFAGVVVNAAVMHATYSELVRSQAGGVPSREPREHA